MTSMEERIAEALREHADWTNDYDASVFKAKMKCYCGSWSEYLEPGQSTAAKFRAHVASVVAGIVRENPYRGEGATP